jgi:hypothetical protein
MLSTKAWIVMLSPIYKCKANYEASHTVPQQGHAVTRVDANTLKLVYVGLDAERKVQPLHHITPFISNKLWNDI